MHSTRLRAGAAGPAGSWRAVRAHSLGERDIYFVQRQRRRAGTPSAAAALVQWLAQPHAAGGCPLCRQRVVALHGTKRTLKKQRRIVAGAFTARSAGIAPAAPVLSTMRGVRLQTHARGWPRHLTFCPHRAFIVPSTQACTQAAGRAAMAAPVDAAAVYDLSLAQRVALPGGDGGLLHPAVTQSLEFEQARGVRWLAAAATGSERQCGVAQRAAARACCFRPQPSPLTTTDAAPAASRRRYRSSWSCARRAA
jgi:hypothetical protein